MNELLGVCQGVVVLFKAEPLTSLKSLTGRHAVYLPPFFYQSALTNFPVSVQHQLPLAWCHHHYVSHGEGVFRSLLLVVCHCVHQCSLTNLLGLCETARFKLRLNYTHGLYLPITWLLQAVCCTGFYFRVSVWRKLNKNASHGFRCLIVIKNWKSLKCFFRLHNFMLLCVALSQKNRKFEKAFITHCMLHQNQKSGVIMCDWTKRSG